MCLCCCRSESDMPVVVMNCMESNLVVMNLCHNLLPLLFYMNVVCRSGFVAGLDGRIVDL